MKENDFVNYLSFQQSFSPFSVYPWKIWSKGARLRIYFSLTLSLCDFNEPLINNWVLQPTDRFCRLCQVLLFVQFSCLLCLVDLADYYHCSTTLQNASSLSSKWPALYKQTIRNVKFTAAEYKLWTFDWFAPPPVNINWEIMKIWNFALYQIHKQVGREGGENKDKRRWRWKSSD